MRSGVAASSIAQAALLGALAALLYLPTLGSGFVTWDDDRLLLDNPAVARADGLEIIWTRAELPAGFPNYPLTFTSYWLERRAWGLDPAGYHAINLLLHGLATALVFLVVRALGLGPWAAAVSAALFAAHPLQVESVAWVAERKNVLSAVWYLAAFLAFLRHRATRSEAAYALALLCCAAALLSKTATLTLPLSLLLADRVLRGRWDPAALARVAPMLLLAAAAALLTMHAEAPAPPIPLPQRPLVAAAALWFYVGQLLAPAVLLPIYPRWAVDPAALRWWLPVAGVLAVAALLAVRRPPGLGHWGIGHFAITLLPVLGLVPFGFTEFSLVADRHVYLASIGLFVVVALGLDWLHQRQARVATLLVVALVVVLAARTERQLAVWRDGQSLWRYVLDTDPSSWLARNNLAMALIGNDRLAEAAPLLEEAVVLRPTYAEAHNNLALVRYRQADYAAAERHSRAAAGLKPYDPTFAKNLGLTLVAQGRADDAEREFRRAIAGAPAAAEVRLLLAQLLLDQGRTDEAVDELRAAVAARPDWNEARQQLAAALARGLGKRRHPLTRIPPGGREEPGDQTNSRRENRAMLSRRSTPA
jgi:Flp pilus assembly protein TadD